MKQICIFIITLGAAGVLFAQDGSVETAAGKAESVKAEAGSHRNAEEAAIREVGLEWGLILRYYPVSDRFVSSMGLATNGTDTVDVTGRLFGVEFPEGASAVYMPSLQKLFVQNTAANLRKIEEDLAALNEAETEASAEQVEIEARFVEYTEGALQDLGFVWSNPNAIESGSWSVNQDQTLFGDALRSVPFTQTGSLTGEEAAGAGEWTANRLEDLFSSSAGTMDFYGNVDGNQLDLMIRALDQTSGADVLSAPSVTTLSGEAAKIVVGERHSYPAKYDQGASQGTMVYVQYTGWKEKVLGVEMDVTPKINGQEIGLKINPCITELAGWENYQLAPANSSYNFYQQRIGMQYEHDPVQARLPVFKRRELKTEVSVANGATIGMGGMIGEKVEAYSDRVPVLGSIPLIGRLFRSEGERTVKRNLAIFVTATKVQPSGAVAERSFE